MTKKNIKHTNEIQNKQNTNKSKIANTKQNETKQTK